MAKTVNKDSDEILLKLLIIGDQSVGKTCLMLRFCDNNFDPVMVSTIGIDMRTKKIQLDGQQVKLQIWDTAGQERFRATTIAYYRDAKGILLVYDVTNESSFKNVRSWMECIEKYSQGTVSVMLIGNKCDDLDKREIATERGEALAEKYGIKFFETSAKTDVNITKAFTALAKDAKRKYMESPPKPQVDTVHLNSKAPNPAVPTSPTTDGNGKNDGGCC